MLKELQSNKEMSNVSRRRNQECSAKDSPMKEGLSCCSLARRGRHEKKGLERQLSGMCTQVTSRSRVWGHILKSQESRGSLDFFFNRR